jgi:preprotein translocase subunit YajC
VKELTNLLPFVLIALVFYLLILRPQRRRQQELATTRSALEPGVEVMLTSGMFGRVASLDDETMLLELAPGTVVKVARAAVARVVDPTGPAEAGPDERIDPPTDRSPDRSE